LEGLKTKVIEKAKELENEEVRRTLYDLYGFLRADNEPDFKVYLEKKRHNREKENINRQRKRLTKGKKK